MAELSPQQHQKSATIGASKGYPRGRVPRPDKLHARLALQFLPRAKNMSGSEAVSVRSRANRMLAGQKSLER